ncbi:hypothetical protein [Paenibacillus elgii]|uniref:hypothetical protein n=1 Tax=Paenibacillus elgii TaxID=189691 RepID=UPI00203C92A0|nr:hypothetical protein [Paenibacillus elgii]MCM3273305.1 hypothetical protein [Paenibacillus elgii]
MKKIILTFFVAIMLLVPFSSAFAAATVGQELKTPEAGWKRYESNDQKVLQSGTWTLVSNANHSNGAYLWSSSAGSSLSFKFYGSKMRLITAMATDRNTLAQVTVDGTVYSYSEYKNTVQYQTLVFELAGLSTGPHTVKISAVGLTSLDAIDIDDTGYLIDSNISAPTNLSAIGENGKIDLRWTAVTGATSYVVKRSTSSGGPYDILATNITSAVYTDSGVTNGVTYYYVVTAMDADSESINSNEASATPLPPLKPTLDVSIVDEKVKVGQEFTANIALKNVNNSTFAGRNYSLDLA